MYTANEFDNLTNLIRLRTGLSVNETKSDNIVQAANDLIQSRRLAGIPALLNLLSRTTTSDAMWQELIDIVTVGETYFFRGEAQFEALRTEVFPALIAKRREAGNKYLRLWCAGCATGEEVYSLAMLLCDLLPDYQSWQITLLATDINATSLDHARRGVYRSWSFRNETPVDIQRRWFEPVGESFKLSKTIKQMVTFGTLNLVSDVFPSFETGVSHMDLIMCRNVTIYFDQDTTRQIVSKFYETLNNNGWLIVGHAEPNSSIYSDFATRNFPNTIFYQKSQTEGMPVAPIIEPVIIPFTPAVPARPSKREVVQRPVEPAITWQQAKAAADLENWHEALVLLARAEAQDKFQPQVFYLRAIVQLHLEDVSGAHASLRQALYCDSAFVLAHYTLGELYESERDFKNAAHHWRLALKAMRDLDADSHLPFGEELTVEMLRGLLSHSLDRISQRK